MSWSQRHFSSDMSVIMMSHNGFIIFCNFSIIFLDLLQLQPILHLRLYDSLCVWINFSWANYANIYTTNIFQTMWLNYQALGLPPPKNPSRCIFAQKSISWVYLKHLLGNNTPQLPVFAPAMPSCLPHSREGRSGKLVIHILSLQPGPVLV